jgi:hypothetical protein
MRSGLHPYLYGSARFPTDATPVTFLQDARARRA